MSSFELNNDLRQIRFNWHNAVHLFGSIITAYLFGFYIGYGAWFVYEISDGFKPWHYAAPHKVKISKFPSTNWFKKELLYSDKFSFQDVVWNLLGALIGSAVRSII